MNDKFLAPPAPIGNQLRALRRAQGWSLEETAHRAKTSAPTLHRYEGGWDQFELRTLRRLAAALEARLEIRLVATGSSAAVARPHAADNPPSTAELVDQLTPLFWDRTLIASDLQDYPEWVIRRVIMFGGLEDVRATRRFFGDDRVQAAAQHRSVDARTQRYWRVLSGAE